jgi:hypothetical protein
VGRVGVKPRSERGSESPESLELGRCPYFEKPMVEPCPKLRDHEGTKQFRSRHGDFIENPQKPNRIRFRSLEIVMLQQCDYLVDGSGYGDAGQSLGSGALVASLFAIDGLRLTCGRDEEVTHARSAASLGPA